jgi:uncharacterized membrane protein YidH (DUF202 family)
MDLEPDVGAVPEPADALDERTRLAHERTQLADDRTLLAWCRTAFGAYVLAVGLGGASLVNKSASSYYAVLGVIFGLVGCAAALLGVWQYLALEWRTNPGRLPRYRMHLVAGFGLFIAVLGAGIALLIVLTR